MWADQPTTVIRAPQLVPLAGQHPQLRENLMDQRSARPEQGAVVGNLRIQPGPHAVAKEFQQRDRSTFGGLYVVNAEGPPRWAAIRTNGGRSCTDERLERLVSPTAQRRRFGAPLSNGVDDAGSEAAALNSEVGVLQPLYDLLASQYASAS